MRRVCVPTARTQVVDATLHSNNNVCVAAPTGSGKTAVLEMAMCRVLDRSGADDQHHRHRHPKIKILYLAPMKALCSERYRDWQARFGPVGVKVMSWTGDVEGELSQLSDADVITTTPGACVVSCDRRISILSACLLASHHR
jgi:ATP-dependent DNA helicase HFM1/MER3